MSTKPKAKAKPTKPSTQGSHTNIAHTKYLRLPELADLYHRYLTEGGKTNLRKSELVRNEFSRREAAFQSVLSIPDKPL